MISFLAACGKDSAMRGMEVLLLFVLSSQFISEAAVIGSVSTTEPYGSIRCPEVLGCTFSNGSCGFSMRGWILSGPFGGSEGKYARSDTVYQDQELDMISELVCNGNVNVSFSSKLASTRGTSQHVDLHVLTQCDGQVMLRQTPKFLRGNPAIPGWVRHSFLDLSPCPAHQKQRVVFRAGFVSSVLVEVVSVDNIEISSDCSTSRDGFYHCFPMTSTTTTYSATMQTHLVSTESTTITKSQYVVVYATVIPLVFIVVAIVGTTVYCFYCKRFRRIEISRPPEDTRLN